MKPNYDVWMTVSSEWVTCRPFDWVLLSPAQWHLNLSVMQFILTALTKCNITVRWQSCSVEIAIWLLIHFRLLTSDTLLAKLHMMLVLNQIWILYQRSIALRANKLLIWSPSVFIWLVAVPTLLNEWPIFSCLIRNSFLYSVFCVFVFIFEW